MSCSAFRAISLKRGISEFIRGMFQSHPRGHTCGASQRGFLHRVSEFIRCMFPHSRGYACGTCQRSLLHRVGEGVHYRLLPQPCGHTCGACQRDFLHRVGERALSFTQLPRVHGDRETSTRVSSRVHTHVGAAATR